MSHDKVPMAELEAADHASRNVRIVALSGRALAQAARVSGLNPSVVDFFGDEDTQLLASSFQLVPTRFQYGFTWGVLKRALQALPQGPIVLGPGFEDRPDLMTKLATLGPVIGCSAENVRRCKDPFHLRDRALAHSVPFAEVALAASGTGPWLRKVRAGAGGGHVRRWRGGAMGRRCYLQRFAPGISYGLSFLMGAGCGVYLGAFRQLRDATPQKPYRFGGLIGPLQIDGDLDRQMADRIMPLLLDLGVRGLVSVDCVIDEQAWQMIEVNPRPGFAIDLLARAYPNIFAAHMRSCADGVLINMPLERKRIFGARVVYAASPWAVPRDMTWPKDLSDRPWRGSSGPKGVPLATVWAEGEHEVDVDSALLRAAVTLRRQLEIIELKQEMDVT